MIDAALEQVPEPARTALRGLIDTAEPEPAPARAPANDNADLGPMSPVEESLYAVEQLNLLYDLVGACHG